MPPRTQAQPTSQTAVQAAQLRSEIQLFRAQAKHLARKRELSWGERQALEELIHSLAELLARESSP